MMRMSLERIAQCVNGQCAGLPAGLSAHDGATIHDAMIDGVTTDTRALSTGSDQALLFVALKGENFDGHDYVAAAAAQGARAALVSRVVDVPLAQIVVADTERALAQLATSIQQARKTVILAVTGSNGKTSVKTLTYAILQHAAAAHGRHAYANPGNRNNEIGVPLAVIDAPEDAEYAIYEMGAGKPGDIAYLAAIARPQVALVNNIAPAHLERMGSLLGIADTKAAIYDALPADGIAVINADDAFAPYFAERAHGHRLIRFALDANADVNARDIVLDAEGSRFVLITPEGEAEVALAMPGRHNVLNALASASLALGAGIPVAMIAAGLNAARPVAGRLITHRIAKDVVLIDDSYNANPGSLNAAIDTLAAASSALRGERWLVLGDMRELGDDAAALHAEAGRRAKASGITRLYTLGGLSAAAANAFGDAGDRFDSHAALADALAADIAARAAANLNPAELRILIKGSRGSAMDKIVNIMLAGHAQPASGGTSHAA